MKGLIIFCLLLAVVTAVPLKGKPKNYSRKQNRQDVAAPVGAAKVATIVPEVAPIEVPTMGPVDIVSTRPVVGNKPFGESAAASVVSPSPPPVTEPEVVPSQAVPTQAAQVEPAVVALPVQPLPVQLQPEIAISALQSSTGEPAAVAAVQPVVVQPVVVQPVAIPAVQQPAVIAAQPVPAEPPAPLAPGTEPVVPPAPVVEVSTKKPESEEEESSEEEEEADSEARILLPVAPPPAGLIPRPSKQDIVVNAYVSSHGEVLVPLDVYQKYFHNSQPLSAGPHSQVPLGIYSRQENEQPSSASSEEEDNEADVSSENSEEIIPIRVSSTSVIYQPKVKPANETDANPNSNVEEDEEDDAEEKEKPASSSSPDETDDKSNSAESEEKPQEVEPVPVQPINSFNPPPLAAIPATRPTGEDDEADAGRNGFPFYDDEFVENEFFSPNNYYRMEEESGYEY